MYINDFPINYPLFAIDNFSYEYDEENILKDLEKKWFKKNNLIYILFMILNVKKIKKFLLIYFLLIKNYLMKIILKNTMFFL